MHGWTSPRIVGLAAYLRAICSAARQLMDEASDIPDQTANRRNDRHHGRGDGGIAARCRLAPDQAAARKRAAGRGRSRSPLRLLDLETSEPVVLVGLRGKVVWVVFWSADSPSATIEPGGDRTSMELAQGARAVCHGGGGHRDRHPDRVRAVAAESGVKLPVYLASAETRRRFGAVEADPPLNVLIDADGRIAAIARGTSAQTIERIADRPGSCSTNWGQPMTRGLQVWRHTNSTKLTTKFNPHPGQFATHPGNNHGTSPARSLRLFCPRPQSRDRHVRWRRCLQRIRRDRCRRATRLVDICLDAGLTMFDSADAYSAGRAEEILGHAIKGRRDKVIISTKSAFRVGPGPNDVGSSRYHLIRAVEGSLKRLGTDYIDLYQLHAFDRTTPVEETLGTLDDLVKAGKIRYIGCSNFSGWHLMKSLAVSKEYGLARMSRTRLTIR